jgi:RNA polymerase sigma factor (sigma-70 family)
LRHTLNMRQNKTDLELVNGILAGDTSLYEVLVKRHQRYVFSLAMRYTKNREEAEEIAQDCFVKVYKSLVTFKQTAKFSTWLYTIAYTTSMTYLRKNKLATNSLDDDQTAFNLASNDVDLLERKSSHRYLNEAIDQLSADDGAIITLFYKAEQSLEEVGQAMGMSANTVKVKLHRARARLREKLQHILKEEIEELL